MKTIWAEKLPSEQPLSFYPRPQLVRDSFLCLNGSWDFSMDENSRPVAYTQTIPVPFCPECELSGIQKSSRRGKFLHYRRFFTLPDGFQKDRVLLHFDAVDLHASVFLNGIPLGTHRGGYWPFCFDITDKLRPSHNELAVTVTDDGAACMDARGKQSAKPGGILYTQHSGIWQSVWLESVPETYIKELKITPDYDAAELRLQIKTNASCACAVELDGVAFATASGTVVHIPLPGFHPWSPEDPFLYYFTVKAGEDTVRSYFAMRKFTAERQPDGTPRLCLNGQPYFCIGVLDQGYWSDGLVTPPSEEAMVCDIQTMKALGFNTLRKHAKVEPLRWYYLCDTMGMLVWQDIVNGGGPGSFLTEKVPVLFPFRCRDNRYRLFGRENKKSRKLYYTELTSTVSLLYNTPSVVLWTAFNEGWGQFDAVTAAAKLKALDPSRLVDHASGWFDQGGGDILSRHIYFRPPVFYRQKPDKRPLCLTEFGGYALCENKEKKIFGYRRFKTARDLTNALCRLWSVYLMRARKKGLSAAIYTQLSDVEQEENGLLSYDRRRLKILPEPLQEVNERLKQEPQP